MPTRTLHPFVAATRIAELEFDDRDSPKRALRFADRPSNSRRCGTTTK
jgi:hypothetical protein